MEKITIGGIRLSGELVQLNVATTGESSRSAAIRFLNEFTRLKINLTFLSMTGVATPRTYFCVEKKKYNPHRETILAAAEALKLELEEILSVGTLSIYPHRSSTEILAIMFSHCSSLDIPVHAVHTSLSAISVNTDYQALDKAARAIQQSFNLPENHSPLTIPVRCDLTRCNKDAAANYSIIETAACYWEPVIKIYGSKLETGLNLTSATFSPDDLHGLAEWLQLFSREHQQFEQLKIARTAHCLCAHIISRNAPAAPLLRSRGIHREADLLFFHGPHFQDRYGVIGATLDCLDRHDHEIIAAGCSGTSIYLILPHEKGEETLTSLNLMFTVPKI